MSQNIIGYNYKIDYEQRTKLNKHQSHLIWFTGLSGSGKSTIANRLESLLYENHVHTYTLDGDNIREGLNSNLSFSPEDRSENIRRIAEVSKLMLDAGLIVIAAFVSPYKKDRDNVKSILGHENTTEVFVNTSLEECERRDVKGLYKKARLGEIKNMTGITAPYETPTKPDIIINTEALSVEEAAFQIFNFLKEKNIISNE